jgi:hypothetical protein
VTTQSLEVAVEREKFEIMLDRMLSDDQIGQPDFIDSVSQARRLHLHEFLPVDLHMRTRDRFQEADQLTLPPVNERRKKLSKDQVIGGDQILVDEFIQVTP